MYNLIMGAVDGILGVERMLEVVDPGLDDFVRPGGNLAEGRLMELPALLMPELGSSSPQIAQIGNIVSLTREGRNYRFRFIRNGSIPNIPTARIEELSSDLGIGQWDFTRTRWSVKAGDLYQVIFERNLVGIPRPTAFVLPPDLAEAHSVAVMMPFSADFDRVWEALQRATRTRGWVCQRADDIWENSVLINDVVALIARSKVVVCDLTGRNSNVFYEAGIAHTLGREVVLITQRDEDVPFDLRHHRYITYLRNREGLDDLEKKIAARLETLLAR